MSVYRFGPFEFDSNSGKLRKHDYRLKLQEKPKTALAVLLTERPNPVSRTELYRCLWSEGVHVDFERGLSVAIKKLRDALDDAIDDPRYIMTVPGVGYRFIADVEEVVPERGKHKAPATPPFGIAEQTPSRSEIIISPQVGESKTHAWLVIPATTVLVHKRFCVGIRRIRIAGQ